ncbi:MAG: hypothetical protein ABI221_03820, partial [Candidatus Saccharimonadales bacterium]
EDVISEVFPFDNPTLDRLFDADTSQFSKVLLTEAQELYEARQLSFGDDNMRKVERDVYLQVLDNLWMQHLENMDHLREGIGWMSVGQRDPLVEYRRQGQHLFEEMQNVLCHDVVRTLMHAEPVNLQEPVETELTRAARQSVDNADKVIDVDEFHEADFKPINLPTTGTKRVTSTDNRKKARKAERQRRQKTRKKR